MMLDHYQQTKNMLVGFVRLLCRDVTKIRAPIRQQFRQHSCSTG